MPEEEKLYSISNRNKSALVSLRNQIEKVQGVAQKAVEGEPVDTQTIVELSNGLTRSYIDYLTTHNKFMKQVVLS